MKRKFVLAVLLTAMALSFVGCGSLKEDVKDGTSKFEGYTILEKRTSEQYLVYDNDTMIMYLLNKTYSSTTTPYSLCPYYVMNENNEPVVGVYNGDEMWEEY